MPAKPGQKPLKPLTKGMGLYQVFHWPDKAPDKSKTWCVANLETGDVNGRWHATEEEAKAQAKAMYASLGNKARYQMSETNRNYLIPVPKQFSEEMAQTDVVWIEALPAVDHHTPQFGIVPITTEKLNNFVTNFKSNVVGTEILTDYEHGLDKAKGSQASGQMVDMKVAPNALGTDTLHVAVKFTDTAKKEIAEKAWRYYSLDWDEEFMDNDGNKFSDVVRGGALTNRPISKRLQPINFSEIALLELTDAQEEEFMEPGSDSPDHKINESGPDAPGHWRVDTPPGGEDGTVPDRGSTIQATKIEGGEMEEFEKNLRESLGLKDDVDVMKYVTDGLSELEGLKDTARQFSENKKFAETYPEEFKRMQKLEDDNRELQSRRFSEPLGSRRIMKVEGENEEETTLGLSALAIEKLQGLHMKFSEGVANMDDFGELVDTLYKGGIVDYGERGSTRGESPEDGTVIGKDAVSVRKQFSEAVEKVLAREGNEKMEHSQAVQIAALENKELAEAYRNSTVVLAAVS